MLDFHVIHQQLSEHFDRAVLQADPEAIDPWIEIVPDSLPQVARYLRDNALLAFDYLNCITGVDYCEPDPKKAAKVNWEPHLELVYHLSSLQQRHRLVLKLKLPRWENDQPGDLPKVPSVSDVWSTADWHEREVYDLMGVEFTNHPDLRRLLCPEDWQGHPLRRDYEMPLEYHGIRGK